MATTERVMDRRLLKTGDEVWQSGRWVTITRIAPSMCGKRTNVFSATAHLFSFTEANAKTGSVTRRLPTHAPLWGRVASTPNGPAFVVAP